MRGPSLGKCLAMLAFIVVIWLVLGPSWYIGLPVAVVSFGLWYRREQQSMAKRMIDNQRQAPRPR